MELNEQLCNLRNDEEFTIGITYEHEREARVLCEGPLKAVRSK